MKKIKQMITILMAVMLIFGVPAEVLASATESTGAQNTKTMVFGTEYESKILNVEQKDVYKMYVPEDGKVKIIVDYNIKASYQLTFSNDSTNISFDDKVLLYTKDTIDGRYKQENGYYRVPAGTYTVTIKAANEVYGETYKIKAEYQKETCEIYEKEVNDVPASATEVQMDTLEDYSITGNLSKPEDKDYYKMVLDTPGTVSISGKVPAKSLYKLEVYSIEDNGTLKRCYICYAGGEQGKKYSKIDKQQFRLPAGMYFALFVNDEDEDVFSNDDYTLTFGFDAETEENVYEREFNNTMDTATVLPVNTPMKGTFTSYAEGENDWYVIELEKAGNLQVNLECVNESGYAYGELILYKANEEGDTEKLDEIYYSSSKKNKVIKKHTKEIKAEAGTYYVCFEYGSGDYLLTANFYPSSKIGKTKKVKAESVAYDSIEITWKNVKNASMYKIYRSTSKNGTYKKIGTVRGQYTTKFTDTKLKTGQKYFYKVKACVAMNKYKEKKGNYSSVVSAKPVPAKIPEISSEVVENGISLKWEKQKGVSGYEIKCMETGKKYTVKKGSKTSYIVRNLEVGNTYTFKMRAYKTVKKKKVYGTYSDIISVQY